MIRPQYRTATCSTAKAGLLPGLALCLALPAAVGAQTVQRDQVRPDQAASWTTTTHVQSPAGKKPAAAVATGSSSAHPAPKLAAPLTGQPQILRGIASYYWQSQKTSTGETFDKMAMTAAHKTLPFGTRVRVTNLVNGRSVVVRINDRGPFKPGRVIDLSLAAAHVIDMHTKGLAMVEIAIEK